MRNNADALNELVNGAGGLREMIDKKLDSDAVITYATRAGSADTADSATKATNDSAGNNIANTYAKKTEIPASVNAYTKTESDARYLGKNDNAASATKATNDSAGNNISTTYAKKSEIPASVNAYTKTESDARYLGINAKAASAELLNSTSDKNIISGGVLKLVGESCLFITAGGDLFPSTIARDDDLQSNVWQGIKMVTSTLKIGGRGNLDGVTYEFKYDGIYRNGTKITN